MNAWASAAGKLARYEHIGWSAGPHSRACYFHSGAIARAGRAAGTSRSRASWAPWRTRVSIVILGDGSWRLTGGGAYQTAFGAPAVSARFAIVTAGQAEITRSRPDRLASTSPTSARATTSANVSRSAPIPAQP